jgi:hypothetical protein
MWLLLFAQVGYLVRLLVRLAPGWQPPWIGSQIPGWNPAKTMPWRGVFVIILRWQWLIADLALARNISEFSEMTDDRVREILAALAHPVRFQIFQSLRGSTGKTAGELAFGDLSAPAVTHHLRQMEGAEVLICTKQ